MNGILIVVAISALFVVCAEGNPRSLLRIKKEWSLLQKMSPPGISAGPASEHNLNEWHATIMGPVGTPYEGGIFRLKLVFGDRYPMTAPRVTFITRIHHPNVSTNGEICLDILKEQWSPALTIWRLLLSLSSLLSDPNFSSPLNSAATGSGYDRQAREMTRQYAMN